VVALQQAGHPEQAGRSALAFAPVFLANLVFAQRFADVHNSGTAFAVNLLGAMVGGALEYLSLVTWVPCPADRDRRPVRAGFRHRPEQQASIPARTCMTRKLALRKRLPGHLGAVRRVWGPG
jgi:hypothetical protein